MQYRTDMWGEDNITLVPHRARRLGRSDVVHVTGEAHLGEVVDLMRQHHIGNVVVVEKMSRGLKPVGMITDRDILLKTFSSTGNHADLGVLDVMSPFLVTAHMDDDVFKMLDVMADEGINRLPIVDELGYLRGVVTAQMIFQHLVQALTQMTGISEQRRSNEKVMKH